MRGGVLFLSLSPRPPPLSLSLTPPLPTHLLILPVQGGMVVRHVPGDEGPAPVRAVQLGLVPHDRQALVDVEGAGPEGQAGAQAGHGGERVQWSGTVRARGAVGSDGRTGRCGGAGRRKRTGRSTAAGRRCRRHTSCGTRPCVRWGGTGQRPVRDCRAAGGEACPGVGVGGRGRASLGATPARHTRGGAARGRARERVRAERERAKKQLARSHSINCARALRHAPLWRLATRTPLTMATSAGPSARPAGAPPPEAGPASTSAPHSGTGRGGEQSGPASPRAKARPGKRDEGRHPAHSQLGSRR